jgi:peptidyl-prolyl cis-trans isomerase C
MRRSQAVSGSTVLALALGLACTGGTSTPPAAAAAPRPAAPAPIDGKTPLPDPLPEVAAEVNGQRIDIQPVTLLAERALKSGNIPADQKAFAYRKALDQIIMRELLFQEASARGLVADQAQLEQAENAERGRYKDPAAWQAALAEMGMNETAFKVELRVQHTVNSLVHKVYEEVPPAAVTDEDLVRYYAEHQDQFTSKDRVRAAHILVRIPAGAGPIQKAAARTKAEGLLAEIQGGADFAAVATKHSEDPASGPRGGEMQSFGRGQMGAELAQLEQAIYALKPGELGPKVVESPAGFHVVKLVAHLPDDVVRLEAVKEQLRHHLLQQKRQEALDALIGRLRDKAKIERHL